MPVERVYLVTHPRKRTLDPRWTVGSVDRNTRRVGRGPLLMAVMTCV